MDRRVAVAVLALLTFLVLPCLTQAVQVRSGYYTWQQINVTGPSTIAVAYATTSQADLVIMTSAQYGNFANGSSYKTLYDQKVYNSGIVTLNVTRGSYYAVMDAKYSNINAGLGVMSAPMGKGRLISINGLYTYAFDIQNYSRVNASWIATGAFNITPDDSYPVSSFNSTTNYQDSWYQNRGTNLNLTSGSLTMVYFYLNVTPTLVSPIDASVSNFSMPQPVGIASYGLENLSGDVVPYVIRTDRIEGEANIISINAYNASPPANVSRYGASMQLNVNLQIVLGSGADYTYWLQNVMDIETHNQSYYLVDNIWNYTGPNANVTNSTIEGLGGVFTSSSNSSIDGEVINTSIYGYSTNYTYYSLPIYFYPVIRVTNNSGYPMVSFGVVNSSGVQYYDNVTFMIPAAEAYLLVTPYYETQSPNFYDSEFVLGGASNGEITQFSNTNVYLQMYYDNRGSWAEFPSLYTFGYDTSEAAQGLRVIQSGNQEEVLGGTPDFQSIIYPGNRSAVTPAYLPAIPPSSTTIMQNTTASNQGQSIEGESPLPGFIAVILVVVAMVALYRAMRSERKTAQQPPNQ